jgi:hypothetical protein
MVEAEGRARLLADLAWALTAASQDVKRVLDTAAESAAALVGDGAVLRVADAAGFLTDTAVYHRDAEMAAAIRTIVDLPDQRAEGSAMTCRRPPSWRGCAGGAKRWCTGNRCTS